MKINETKALQRKRLKEICDEKNVNHEALDTLLSSVKTKKLLKRNNFHQQKINDVIENSTK